MEGLLNLTMLMAQVFVPMPVLAALPAALFLWLFHRHRKASCMFTGALWLTYLCYEGAMYLRIFCSGECNIRVDLMMLYPLLMAFSLFAGIVALSRELKRA